MPEGSEGFDRMLEFPESRTSGNISTVVLLLRNGADIGEKNERGQTSLHISALNGDLEMTRALLETDTMSKKKITAT